MEKRSRFFGSLQSLLVLVSLSLVFAVEPAHGAESIKADHVRIDWLAPTSFGDRSTKIGIRFRIDRDWHVYWKNPGDSGAVPRFEFAASTSVVGPILWPFPHRLPVSDLTNFGYSDEVVYLFEVTPTEQSVNLNVKLEWLVCKEACIPGFGNLTLQRPVLQGEANWNTRDLSQLQKFESRLPQRGETSPWKLLAQTEEGDRLRLILKNPAAGEIPPEVFPVNGEWLNPGRPVAEKTDDGFHLIFRTAPGQVAPAATGFLLVDQEKSFEFDAIPVQTLVGATSSEELPSLLILLLSAFLGGLILNLMPCVLPVLSIKFFSLTKAKESHRLQEAGLYTVGVLVTFAVLGGLFLSLRAAGAAVGWGFQLQSPLAILVLILLFWSMALNFLGVFEFGTQVMNWAGSSKSSSSFATGVLSVFVAAPCTGPFMGTALGAAATVGTVSAMAIFLSLGLGLASPFLVLAVSPGLLKKIPKPGAWMESLKQFFAFPLFATVLWLLWVLGMQTNGEGWLIAGTLLLIISFAFWLGQSSRRFAGIVAWVLAVVAIIVAVQEIRKAADAPKATIAESSWISYDRAKIDQARANKQPVFVDFTAAWCITCQVNKKAVLRTDAAAEIFAKNQVLLVEGDWTRQDPVITKALAEFGRNSVPVYVFYGSDGSQPRILPQILSMQMIEDLFQPKTEETK